MGVSTSTISALAAHWPVDWIILGAFAVFIALDVLRAGSNRASALALSAPIASVLSTTITKATLISSIVKPLSSGWGGAVLFLALLVVSYIFVRRICGLYAGFNSGAPIQALLAGVATTAIVTVVWVATPVLSQVWQFGAQVQGIFGEQFGFWWLLAALATLAFVRD